MDYCVFSKLCNKAGTTPTALALKLGLSKGNTSSWKKGGNPSAEILIKLADELNCTTDLLLGREKNSSAKLSINEMELLDIYNSLAPNDQIRVIERAQTLRDLSANTKINDTPTPIISIKHSLYMVSAGTGYDLSEGDNWDEIEVPDTPEARRSDFCLTIHGNSMEPVYYDGDIVLVKQQSEIERGQIGIFIIEGCGYIKKFGGDRLISLNEEYDDIMFADYDPDDIRCSGLVIGRV